MEEAVDKNLKIAKENQEIVKQGKKWLAALYEAYKEKYQNKATPYDEDDSDENADTYRNLATSDEGNYLDNLL